LRYLERELEKRKQLGKVATVAGIATVSFGMAMASATTFSSCIEGDIKPPMEGDAPYYDTIPNQDTIPNYDTTQYLGFVGDWGGNKSGNL